MHAFNISGALAQFSKVTAAAGALALTQLSAHAQSQECLSETMPVASLAMRVLLISADGTEAVLPAMKSTLEYLGIPYDMLLARDQLLTADTLCRTVNGTGAGRYQAVILATGGLGFYNRQTSAYESAFTYEEWQRLWRYEAKYRVRQATLYTYPGGWPDSYGLTPPNSEVDTTNNPLTTKLTTTDPTNSGNPSGRQVFSYLQPTNPVTLRHAYTYLATPAAGATVTPLLVDAAGNAIASINNYADGRKNLALTTDGNPGLIHTLSLNYGIVNWVTKGLYMGQRRVSMTAQPDDVLIADDLWSAAANSDATGLTYRITSHDLDKLIEWQKKHNKNERGSVDLDDWQRKHNKHDRGSVVLDMPFNAFGSSKAFPVEQLYPAKTDNLTPAVKKHEQHFNWLSHTYTHLNLDAPVNYSQTLSELRQNHQEAVATLRLENYDKDSLVTPDVSGLNNPEALRAMSDFGIRYVVSDTSRNCGNRDAAPRPCPAPNTGIYNDLQPNILMVPRYPANLFYNVCTPAEWVSEYNFIYRSYWGRDLTYDQILDKESEIWLRYLMNHDLRPVMFHQPNLCAYDGTRSLLGDLIDRTLSKFNTIFNLPVTSRRLRQVGHLMAERMSLIDALNDTSNPLTVTIVPGPKSSSIVLHNPTSRPVVVPLTGINWSGATTRETLGGQITSKVTVAPNGGTLTLSGAPAW